MDTNQIIEQNNSDDGLELRDLFLVLWKQKVVIISITLIIAILTGIFSLFVLSPVYQSNLNIVINMPATFNTRFGEYTLPITSNQQYISLIKSNNVLLSTIKDLGYDSKGITVEDLSERITIGSVSTNPVIIQNSYDITISADNPQEALNLANTLYANYIEFLDVMVKERAILYFYDKFSIEIKSLNMELGANKEILMKNEKLLSEIPQTINQKDAIKEIQNQIDTSDFVVLENIINPNYTKLVNDIILNKQLIFGNESEINLYTSFIGELDINKKEITEYYETSNTGELELNMIGIIDTCVYLPSQPVAPTNKTSPNNTQNVIIGAVLGGILSVFVVFIREYWFKKA